MMTGHHRCLLLQGSKWYLESKKSENYDSWNGDLLNLCPEAAIEKFLTKGQVLQTLLCNVAILHLRSALLAFFSRF